MWSCSSSRCYLVEQTSFGPVKQSTDDTVLCRDGMMAVPLEILISMGRFSIYSC